MYRVTVILPTVLPPGHPSYAFRRHLRELGYVEGQNVSIDYRSAEGQLGRLPELVADAVRLKADVLVVGSTVGAFAAKSATTTVPIVFVGVSDPVAQGLVPNLAHPGGNVTGISMAIVEGFRGKWVELLKDALPKASRFAVLWNSTAPAKPTFVREMRTAAATLKIRLDLIEVQDVTQFDSAFAVITASRAQGMIVTAAPLLSFSANGERLIQFAATKRLPAMYPFRDFVEAGGLMAYGPSLTDSFSRAAIYVDKILKGAKPADLPVEQPTQYQLVINLKTVKALALTIPSSLLLRADEVIQ
jgi:putative ABC transport system substrate-binding protein